MEIILPWLVAGIAVIALIISLLRQGGTVRKEQDILREAEILYHACTRACHEANTETERNLATRMETKLDNLAGTIQQGGAGTERSLTMLLGQLRQEQGKISDNTTSLIRRGQDALQLLFSEKMREMAEKQTAQMMQIRNTVEEQLHGAVEKQMQTSFQRVAEQMATMQAALGEVRGMTGQMSDLKRLFSNIKTRGGWGEAQCRIILEDILPGRYETNCKLAHDSREEVEFAVRMPVRGKSGTRQPLLAIDSKFPTASYERLILAAEQGDAKAEAEAVRELEKNIRLEAAKISSKYIRPPVTVDFAVLYLPTDGLYAEIARMPGVVDSIGRECRVIIMGPSLLPALLRTVSLGYMTLALEERTEGISRLLGETRSEMIKMDKVLEKLYRNNSTMGNAIEEARKRTRVLRNRLKTLEEPKNTENSETTGTLLPEHVAYTHDGTGDRIAEDRMKSEAGDGSILA